MGHATIGAWPGRRFDADPPIRAGEDAMDDIVKVVETTLDLTEPVTVGVEAYVSEEYARAEREVNTNTTRTLVNAALRLVDELSEGTPPEKVRAC
jgi:hypothetical protein